MINKKTFDDSSWKEIVPTVTDTISKVIGDLQTAMQTAITGLLSGPQNLEQPMVKALPPS